MRAKRKNLLIGAAIVLIIAVVVFVWILKANNESSPNTGTSWFAGQGESDVYVFPAEEEWINLEPTERYSALQIPENILKNMSTAGLAETCINYPMFAEMVFYDSLELGFAQIKRRFNGLQELFTRPDVTNILVSIFISMDLNKLDKYDDYPTMKFHYVCIMLYQEPVINALTGEQKKDLLEAISEKRKLINSKYKDHYSLYNLEILEQRIR